MKHICIYLIELYRRYISPLKSKPTCRFYPSCSCYAIDAYKKHGFFGGSYLTLTRIMRCNPFFEGGIDEVPEKIVLGRKQGARSNENGDLK